MQSLQATVCACWASSRFESQTLPSSPFFSVYPIHFFLSAGMPLRFESHKFFKCPVLVSVHASLLQLSLNEKEITFLFAEYMAVSARLEHNLRVSRK